MAQMKDNKSRLRDGEHILEPPGPNPVVKALPRSTICAQDIPAAPRPRNLVNVFDNLEEEWPPSHKAVPACKVSPHSAL